MANSLQEIVKKILKANDIAIYCHTNPDGDALGSMLSLYSILKKKGKDVHAFCDTEIINKYNFMPNIDVVTFPDKKSHELGISVDTSSIDRLGKCYPSFLKSKSTIAIDHHKTYENFADLSYVVKDMSSCCQIMYKIAKELKGLDNESVSLIYTGMVTDSGCFAFDSVNGETHEIVAEILNNYKIDHAKIMYDAYRSISFERFNLKIQVLSKAKFYSDNQIAIIVFNKDLFESTNTTIDETEGIITELINIKDVKIAYAISEAAPKSYKISIRSKDGVDASSIANYYGGGGHKAAAGCRVNGYLEDIIEHLLKLANDRI